MSGGSVPVGWIHGDEIERQGSTMEHHAVLVECVYNDERGAFAYVHWLLRQATSLCSLHSNVYGVHASQDLASNID